MSRLNTKAWALTFLLASCGGAAEGDPDEGAGPSTGGDGTTTTGGSESEATGGTGRASTDSSGVEPGAGSGEESGDAAGGVSSGDTGGAETAGTEARPTGGEATGATGGEATGATGGEATGATGGEATGATGGEAGGVGGTGGGGNLACDVILGPCTLTWHSPESGATTTTTYFYNALGQLERQEEDRDGDGVTDHIVRYTYDEQGRLLQSKADSCDAVATLDPTCEQTDYTYDEQGNVLVKSYYTGAPIATSGCTYYSYNEDGLLLSSDFYNWCEETLPGDSITYDYDAAGRLIADHGPWGTTLYEYDAAGQVSAKTYLGADGIVTLIVTYTRNAAGQPLIEERQYPDGDDNQLVRTYDASGNQLTQKLVTLEGDSAGSEAYCRVATYDDCGNQLTEIFFPECTDVVTTEYAWSYACFAE